MHLLSLARLVRLPNVFTAFADIALGLCVTIGLCTTLPPDLTIRFLCLFLASGCLYMAGMVWNDYFDLTEDAKVRPFRPLPSGKITIRTAVIIGTILTVVGIGLAVAAGRASALIAGLLVVAILAYDARIKRTRMAPIGMAVCRFLNVLLGLSLASLEAIPASTRAHLAFTIGLYIVGVTWFARTEEKRSDPKVLAKAALCMLAAGIVGLAIATRLPPGREPSVLFPYLLVGWAFWVGPAVYRAMRTPTPSLVQAGVKRAIFGLVGLDAVLATVFVGAPGLLIVLLLLPAIMLGKWVYST